MKTYSKSNHRWCSTKKVFLNISQKSCENTCAKASFLIKLPEACNFIKKRDSGTGGLQKGTPTQVFS